MIRKSRYYPILIVATFILFVLAVLILSSGSSVTNKKSPNPTITSFPITSPTIIENLSVISSSPQNNQINIPLDTPITIVFNKNIEGATLPITFVPQTGFTTKVQSNTLTLIPQNNLIPGVQYFIRVKLSGYTNYADAYNLTFTTTGPTPTALPDTRDQNMINNEQNYQRQSQTDVFLANNTPYSGAAFSVVNNFVPGNPTGHYHFTVTLNGDQTTAKNNFISWLHSLQLTDEEIQTLDITYQ